MPTTLVRNFTECSQLRFLSFPPDWLKAVDWGEAEMRSDVSGITSCHSDPSPLAVTWSPVQGFSTVKFLALQAFPHTSLPCVLCIKSLQSGVPQEWGERLHFPKDPASSQILSNCAWELPYLFFPFGLFNQLIITFIFFGSRPVLLFSVFCTSAASSSVPQSDPAVVLSSSRSSVSSLPQT